MRVPKPAPPRMGSVEAACVRANVSRAKFYKDWMPLVRSAKFAGRRMVDLTSVDEVIDQKLAEQGTAA